MVEIKGIMSSEILLSNDTIKKLKSLLGNFNTFGNKIDMYSLCIKNTLNPKAKV